MFYKTGYETYRERVMTPLGEGDVIESHSLPFEYPQTRYSIAIARVTPSVALLLNLLGEALGIERGYR